MNEADAADKLVAATGGKMKVVEKAPADALHVCSLGPSVNHTNHEGVCHVCQAKVYFHDVDQSHLKKVCSICALKMAKGRGVEGIVTQNTVSAVVNYLKRN